MTYPAGPTPSRVVGYTLTAIVGIVLIVGLSVGAAFGCKAYTRYQKRADAENAVKVTAIATKNALQRVEVAKIENELKHQQAIGQRKANEEIATKLTPLFVQYEMIEALKESNSSVIYIPAGANGVPLVSVTGKPQVLGGADR